MRYAIALLAVMFMTYCVPQLAEAQTQSELRATCYEQLCHVKITKDGFVPKTLIIRSGTTIVWTNTDDGRHTVTSGSPGEITAPLKSLMLEKDDTYEFIFEYSGLYKGSYKYFDQITKIMRGEIIVEAEPEKVEEKPQPQMIGIDFNNPESGITAISLSNGSVKSTHILPESNSLLINIETDQTNGKLEITLDRTLIDATADGDDSSFAVLVEGQEGFFDETSSTPADRTLEIVVPAKTTKVEIVGTQVVPEFPSALLMVGSVFAAMLFIYSKVRL
jgi:plastocyanin